MLRNCQKVHWTKDEQREERKKKCFQIFCSRLCCPLIHFRKLNEKVSNQPLFEDVVAKFIFFLFFFDPIFLFLFPFLHRAAKIFPKFSAAGAAVVVIFLPAGYSPDINRVARNVWSWSWSYRWKVKNVKRRNWTFWILRHSVC